MGYLREDEEPHLENPPINVCLWFSVLKPTGLIVLGNHSGILTESVAPHPYPQRRFQGDGLYGGERVPGLVSRLMNRENHCV